MNKWIVILILLILTACKDEVEESYFTSEKALYYFRQIEAVCNEDNGKLWGRNLYGPLMFVDRTTRRMWLMSLTGRIIKTEGWHLYRIIPKRADY